MFTPPPASNSLRLAVQSDSISTHGEIKGDTTTLEDFQVIAKLRESDEG